MQRVNIVGPSSSGKTTLARILAEEASLPHVELDTLYRHENGRVPNSHDIFVARVREVTAQDVWMIDGDRRTVRDLIWQRADTVFWLDYPLPTVLLRYFIRTLRRRRATPRFWPETGPPEGWRRLLRRNSLLRSIVGSHRRRRWEIEALVREYPQVTLYRFRRPIEAEAWLRNVGPPAG